MKKEQFQKLVQLATGRDFQIDTNESELKNETEYFVFRKLPVSGRKISFKWVSPKSDEKYLRSFITAFCSKYREPNPAAYTRCAPYFSPNWNDMTPETREYAYYHHASNMYSKKDLMSQVEANFNNPEMTKGFNRYGFYATEYGVGTYILFATQYVLKSVSQMTEYLKAQNISFVNEYSDAGWVLRFKINATKQIHENLISSFSN